MRRKFLTSASRRSMSSTRKTPEHRNSSIKLPIEVAEAAQHEAAEVVQHEAAEAVQHEAVEAVQYEAAAAAEAAAAEAGA